MKNQIVFITGVSGTGKSTVLHRLKELNYSVIGIDEEPGLTHWIHKETGERASRGSELTKTFLGTYDWRCDSRKLADLLAQTPKPLFICGSADNVTELIDMADVTLLLVCSPEIFTSRIDSRIGNDYGKDEESRSALLGYYVEYNKICLDAGAIAIDAEQSFEQVVESILEKSSH